MAIVNLQQKASLETMERLGDIAQDRLETSSFRTAAIEQEPETPAEEFKDRNGYDDTFLKGWNIALPLATGKTANDMQQLKRGGDGVELKYRNFSVVMSASRRMPMLTAVNINGSKTRKTPRIDTWSFDGRLDKENQWGDELYNNNVLDRGHMVRREDPVWGTESGEANADTFHFTNCCPQIAGVNQKTWLGLEDYILQNARIDKMMVNVYTGPFFTKNDLEYRGAKIPLSFWKVVAIVTDTGRPSATAYMVSQEKELSQLGFVYSQYKTFQISVQQVIDKTGLNFTSLVEYDGFSQHEKGKRRKHVKKLVDLEDILI